MNSVNCWETLRASNATKWSAKTSLTAMKSVEDWDISSQGSRESENKVQRLKPKAKALLSHADNRVAHHRIDTSMMRECGASGTFQKKI